MTDQATLQFLGVWAELEAAYYGQNGYGGNVAEIYAYRLLPLDPQDPIGEKRGEIAAHEIERMLKMFAHVHSDARFGIEVGYRVFMPFLPTRLDADHDSLKPFSHRIHIQVTQVAP